MLHTVLRDSVTSDISPTSATNTNCSPRWIVHPQSRGWGAARSGATTPQGCLDACVRTTNCRTAEWGYRTDLAPGIARCWIYWREPSDQQREHHRNIVQFDIVRACFTTPGRWCITHDYVTFCWKVIKWLLPRDAMLAWYTLWPCVCLSVCLSVCHKSVFYCNGSM